MPRKTKIGTEVTHVTRYSDTTFKVTRSKVKVTRPLWLVVLADEHGHTVMTCIVSPFAALGGCISWRPPVYSLFQQIRYFRTTMSHICILIRLRWRFEPNRTPVVIAGCRRGSEMCGLNFKRQFRVQCAAIHS